MPELPEVETIKNDLRALVIGRKIVDVEVLDPEIAHHIDLSRFIPDWSVKRLWAWTGTQSIF